MKVSTKNDNDFVYEKITILVDNIPLRKDFFSSVNTDFNKYELLREVLCIFGGIYFQYNWVGN